jgi:hypothetical protein
VLAFLTDRIVLLAQGATGSTDVLIQYGALGLLCALALGAVRVLFQREARTLDLERQRADRLEDELRRLNESIHNQYVPTLTQATEAIARALKTSARRDDL